MKKVLKWIGIILLGILLIGTLVAFYLKSKFENLDKRSFSYNPKMIEIPSDSASFARGKLLSVGCRECHGPDLGGKDFFNDPAFGYMSSPNLTPGKGSATEKYTDKDWLNALRHGINPAGKPLMIMPSESIGLLNDIDLGALIAYLKSAPPVDKPRGPTHFTFMASVMAGSGLFGNLYPHDIIEHNAMEKIETIPVSALPVYGEYLTKFHGCKTCHGKNLNGGLHPDPVFPPVPNITTQGNFGKWTLEQFKQTLRTGTTPEGKIMDSKSMPWAGIGVHTDTELEALYNYLKSIPAMENDPAYDKKVKALGKK